MNFAVAASVSAVVWAAMRTGVGYSAGASFIYGVGFFVAGALFLDTLEIEAGVRGTRDE
jgi:hypothetical protein